MFNLALLKKILFWSLVILVQDFNDTTQFFGEFAKLFLQESGAILALVQDTYHI